MDDTQTISTFINGLEQTLNQTFKRVEQGLGYVIYAAETAPIKIIVYSKEQPDRIYGDKIGYIHLDVDRIREQEQKIISRIQSLYYHGKTYYARQTVIARVDKGVTMEFLNEHHYNSAFPGKYRYGLFYQGELLSIAVFSGGRKKADQAEDFRSFELIRFCHKSGYRVTGGLSKLLKKFTEDFSAGDIMTYVDKDWTQASKLTALGFEEVGTLAPLMYWVEGAERKVFHNEQERRSLEALHPAGYRMCNSGSIKLILTTRK